MLAEMQATLLCEEMRAYRREIAPHLMSSPGMCMADAWRVSQQTLSGDFDFDPQMVEQLLMAGGAQMRAAPAARAAGAPQGPGLVERYLNPPPSPHPAGSPQRFGDEAGGSVWGAGNILANSTSAAAGALQAVGQQQAKQLLAEGLRAVLSGAKQSVPLGPGMELYNAAQGKQAPRVRLRVRGLPMQAVQAAIPNMAGSAAAAQWRPNGPGTAATLRAGTMSPDQLRRAAALAGHQGLPRSLQWATGKVGGGVLTFVPSAAVDLRNSITTDRLTGRTQFSGHDFLIASARSQSGNLVGFGTSFAVGAILVGSAALVGWPLLVIALGAGILAQWAWNSFGGSDASAGLAERALR
jgi:hypothetical protein